MGYLTLKWFHILSSTLLLGAGLAIAFFLWMAHRSRDPRTIAATARVVVLADAIITAPAVLVQLGSGLWLGQMLNLPLSTLWIATALLLFAVMGLCWLPVVWLQWRARNLARQAVASGTALPAAYARVMRWWFWLGWPALISVIAIFWLMVAKPL